MCIGQVWMMPDPLNKVAIIEPDDNLRGGESIDAPPAKLTKRLAASTADSRWQPASRLVSLITIH